jgi:hypothetical protein
MVRKRARHGFAQRRHDVVRDDRRTVREEDARAELEPPPPIVRVRPGDRQRRHDPVIGTEAHQSLEEMVVDRVGESFRLRRSVGEDSGGVGAHRDHQLAAGPIPQSLLGGSPGAPRESGRDDDQGQRP